jgi:hypothetical protein
VVRQRFAKPPYAGSNPVLASGRMRPSSGDRHALRKARQAAAVPPAIPRPTTRARPLGGMADAGDLKSLARKGVPVRVRQGLRVKVWRRAARCLRDPRASPFLQVSCRSQLPAASGAAGQVAPVRCRRSFRWVMLADDGRGCPSRVPPNAGRGQCSDDAARAGGAHGLSDYQIPRAHQVTEQRALAGA